MGGKADWQGASGPKEALSARTKGKLPLPDTTAQDSDSPTAGLLSGWAASWPATGWAFRVVRKGLSWPWIRCPPLRRPLFTTRVKSPILRHVQDILQVGMVEPISGLVFTSHLSVTKPGCSVCGYYPGHYGVSGFQGELSQFSSDANPTPMVAGHGVGYCFCKDLVVTVERQQDSSQSFSALCLEDDDSPPVKSLAGFPKRYSKSLPPRETTALQACQRGDCGFSSQSQRTPSLGFSPSLKVSSAVARTPLPTSLGPLAASSPVPESLYRWLRVWLGLPVLPGHQVYGSWESDINAKELHVSLCFLRAHRGLRYMGIIFEMDNSAVILLSQSPRLF
ncbi:hypothetical protein E2C01_048141 [Portunus trituberculatus]|uniref:Uncharacterized protein n=1 Tax=Portunus trituberculatus TaxID=210409 RepID=A0A5B7G2W8_PORTR|nr:hypothetical protein [Portunus trituberculatus]